MITELNKILLDVIAETLPKDKPTANEAARFEDIIPDGLTAEEIDYLYQEYCKAGGSIRRLDNKPNPNENITFML